MPEWKTAIKEIKTGAPGKLKDEKDIAILSLGYPGNFATAPVYKINVK